MTDLAEYLLPKPPPDRDSWRWATVTAVSPLRVRLDGDSTPLDLTPDALGSARVGDRVWCQMVGRRVVVQPVNRGPLRAATVGGSVTFAEGISASTTITWPVGTFTATPTATASVLTNTANYAITTVQPDASSVLVIMRYLGTGTSTQQINLRAIGMQMEA